MPAQTTRQATPAPQQSTPASGPSSASERSPRGSQQWAAGQQGRRGNEAVSGMIGGPVQDQVPQQLDLQDAGLHFRIPGDLALTSGWNPLKTTAPTSVWFTVSRTELRVQFHPALLVDATWPLSNVAWSGFTYDFAKGRLTNVGVENTQFAIPIAGKVDEQVRGFVSRLVAGTPLGRGGYDPMADADLAGTLKLLQSNLQAQGSASDGGALDPSQVQDVGFNASFKTRSRIEAGSGDGMVAIGAGASLSANVAVEGSGATLGSGGVPNIRSVHLSSSDLVISQSGKPVARIRTLRVDRGGAVDILDFEPLGTLAEVGAGESIIRLLGILAATRGADPRLAGGGDISPRLVNGVAEAQIEKSLSDAIRQLVRDHHDAVPGIDLLPVLGISPEPGRPARPGQRS